MLSFFWSLPVADFGGWESNGLDAWKDEVATLWPESRLLLERIGSAAQLARARYRDAVLSRWHHGHAVLVGDAAHAMSPQLGQGVNMALMDAMALSGALRTHGAVTDALAAYQRDRRSHVAIYQSWSRWLTPMFQSRLDAVAKLRDIALRPAGRLPFAGTHMLRVLSGTQRGFFGSLPLDPAFLQALHGRLAGKGMALD